MSSGTAASKLAKHVAVYGRLLMGESLLDINTVGGGTENENEMLATVLEYNYSFSLRFH